MKIFSSLIGVLLVALAVSFALSNRQMTAIGLWPFDVAMTAPLYLLTLGALCFGLLLGAGIAWLSLLPHRFASRRLHADVAALHHKLNNLQSSVAVPTSYRVQNVADLEDPLPLHRRIWRYVRGTNQ
jgi:uncharacterized integral membrane protein